MYIVGLLMALVGLCFVLSMIEKPPGGPPPGMPRSGRRLGKQPGQLCVTITEASARPPHFTRTHPLTVPAAGVHRSNEAPALERDLDESRAAWTAAGCALSLCATNFGARRHMPSASADGVDRTGVSD